MIRGWLSKKAELSSSQSLNTVDELQSLDEAMQGTELWIRLGKPELIVIAANLILDDDIEGAEKGLANNNSSFHTLGKGMIAFLRAALGFELEHMRQASERLAAAESAASSDHRRSQRDPTGFRSKIYAPGSEYALCHAEAQLMSAVVAVLNESLTESIKGFYKLRKAYVTLDSIVEAEHRFVSQTPQLTRTNTRRSSLGSTNELKAFKEFDRPSTAPSMKKAINKSSTQGDPNENSLSDESSDEEFEDAKETQQGMETPDAYQGQVEIEGIIHELAKTSVSVPQSPVTSRKPSKDNLNSFFSPSKLPIRQVLSHPPEDDIFENPVDVFIHSGTNLCFGILLLIISLIPPAFGKLLYIIGFKGDRERGIRMLWQSSRFRNVNGAIAGLVLLGYYNGLVGLCDILPDTDGSADNVEGYPKERLEALLLEMRSRYPHSKLWLLEEARMQAARRNLDKGIDLLSGETQSPLKQVQALSVFERSLQAMYAHRYELTSHSFQECCALNNWSHALYLYIAGAAHVELYRSAREKKESYKADTQAQKASDLFRRAKAQSGRKRFMARPLPFDEFVVRKVDKWDHRAKEWDVSFVDAIGTSPLEEMIYFWNGHKKMDSTQLEQSLQNLSWVDDVERNPSWTHEGLDEKAILAVIRAATFRALGRHAEAKELLRNEVLSHDRNAFKGHLKDDWTCPTAHYEMAANCWMEMVRDRQGSKEDATLVNEAEEWLEKASKWESYSLDARIGMKITTGIDTIKGWKADNDQ